MYFSPVIRRSAFVPAARPADRAFDRWLSESLVAPAARGYRFDQDEKSYTLGFDLPGVAKDQLNIGIEGNVVRLETKAEAPRQYKAAYELPLDIDAQGSEAKLENGVLTLKLAKKVPVSNVAHLAVQ
jgi:HSP20 family molecular chaperone IbpA